MNENFSTTTTSASSELDSKAARGNSNSELAATWTEVRLSYPLYAALATHFHLAELPHQADEQPPVRPTRTIFERDLNWIDQLDEKVFAYQIRQLPSDVLGRSEENLRSFIQRQLKRQRKTASDRDKVDLLLVQYFAQYAPDQLYRQEIELQDVAQVLRPVLGDADATPLDWCEPLNGILGALEDCRSLRDLLEAGLLEQGRLMKDSAGANYYDHAALVSFCRFNFLLRRAFIRLLHADLRAVKEAIDALEARGVRTADCRRAGLSAAETTTDLRRFCENWRQPFQKDYTESSVTAAFEQLLALRTDLEEGVSGKASRAELLRNSGRSESDNTARGETDKAQNTNSSDAEAKQENKTAAPTANSAQNTLALPKPNFKLTASGVAEADKWLEAIWNQLRVLPSASGRSMSTIVLGDTKVLLSSWEGDAFVGEDNAESEDLRRAVVARALLSVAIDQRKRSGEMTALSSASAHAMKEAAYFQMRVEQSKQAKNAEAAVNLAISAKRLLALIEEAEKLQP
jgi:hypothetical protein